MARVSLSQMSTVGDEPAAVVASTTKAKRSRPLAKPGSEPIEMAAAVELPTAPEDRASGQGSGDPTPTAPPPATAPGPSGLTIVGVSVPSTLYQELTAALESVPNDLTPSYAQMVSWTCADHPEQVAEAALAYALGTGRVSPSPAPDAPARRRPRGRPPRAGASAKLTLRFHGDELDPVVALERRPVPEGVRMTRTAVAAGALRVALDSDLLAELMDE